MERGPRGRHYEPMNRKQAAILLVMGFVSWIPVTVFLMFFIKRLTPRELGIVGLINMLIFVLLLIFVYRRWVSRIR